jgi:hypothetical protein
MFKTGDVVEILKPYDVRKRATIIDVDENGKRTVALVKRHDYNTEDVWAWHPFQVGVSVFKIHNA